jgi:large subunit ribosomal protein L10
MNKSIIEQKELLVNEVSEELKNSASSIVVEYRGLTVAKLSELRRELRKQNATLKVYKNSIMTRAANLAGYSELESELTGPNAIVFSETDSTSAAKLLTKFARRNDELVVKGGIVEGKYVDAQEMKVVATLPNKEGMLSMLLSCLQAPIRNFACAVKAVADKQEN